MGLAGKTRLDYNLHYLHGVPAKETPTLKEDQWIDLDRLGVEIFNKFVYYCTNQSWLTAIPMYVVNQHIHHVQTVISCSSTTKQVMIRKIDAQLVHPFKELVNILGPQSCECNRSSMYKIPPTTTTTLPTTPTALPYWPPPTQSIS